MEGLTCDINGQWQISRKRQQKW